MGADLGFLADKGEVDIADPVSCLAHQFDGVEQELVAAGALPLRIARRKMVADVAAGNRAEKRIDNGMECDVSIAMAGQALVVLDPNAAEPQFLASDKPMHVKTHSSPYVGSLAHEILRKCQFFQALVTLDQRHFAAVCAQDLRIVAGILSAGPRLMRIADRREAKRLRCLYAPQDVPICGPAHYVIGLDREAVDDGEGGYCTLVAVQCRQQAGDHGTGHVGTRSVVDQDEFGRIDSA